MNLVAVYRCKAEHESREPVLDLPRFAQEVEAADDPPTIVCHHPVDGYVVLSGDPREPAPICAHLATLRRLELEHR